MILERASQASGLPISTITGRQRTTDVCMVRWAIMDVLRAQGMSLSAIGRLLHRDHSTVISGLRRADGLSGHEKFSEIRSSIA